MTRRDLACMVHIPGATSATGAPRRVWDASADAHEAGAVGGRPGPGALRRSGGVVVSAGLAVLALALSAPAAAAPPSGQKTVFYGCSDASEAPAAAAATPAKPEPEPPFSLSRDALPALPPTLPAPAPIDVTVTVRNRSGATHTAHVEVSFCRFGQACRTVGARVQGAGGKWPMPDGEERVVVVGSQGPLDPGAWTVNVALVRGSTVVDRWSGPVQVGQPGVVLDAFRTPTGGVRRDAVVPWSGEPIALDVLLSNTGSAPEQVQVVFSVANVLGPSRCVSEIYAPPTLVPAGASRQAVTVTWQPPLGGDKAVSARVFGYAGAELGAALGRKFRLAPGTGGRAAYDARQRCGGPSYW